MASYIAREKDRQEAFKKYSRDEQAKLEGAF
jgi:hypothetical protein